MGYGVGDLVRDGVEIERDGVGVGWSGSGSTMFKLKTHRQN